MAKRLARVLAAGTLGVVVALLILLLRPHRAPSDAALDARPPPPSRLDRAAPESNGVAAARRAEIELPVPATELAVESSVSPVDGLARAVAVSNAARGPTMSAAENPSRGEAGRGDDREAGDDEEGSERPAFWCFLKTRDDHDYASDSSVVWNGSRSVWIGKQNDAAADGGYFSADILWQGVDATAFRGRRIEVSAQVRGKGYFQFFVRTAAATDTGIVLHDNQLPTVPTTNRYVNLFPPRGEWERLSIVADVPVEADVVYYGFALMGGRAIWLDDVRIESVDPQTPLTAEQSIGGRFILPVNARAALAAPANFDFEVTTRYNAGC
jgi:hypothetical protein